MLICHAAKRTSLYRGLNSLWLWLIFHFFRALGFKIKLKPFTVFENSKNVSFLFQIWIFWKKYQLPKGRFFVYKSRRVLVKVSCCRPNWDFLKYFSNTVIFWKSSIIKMEILEGRYNLSGKSSNEAVPLLFTISQFWRTSKWIMCRA